MVESGPPRGQSLPIGNQTAREAFERNVFATDTMVSAEDSAMIEIFSLIPTDN